MDLKNLQSDMYHVLVDGKQTVYDLVKDDMGDLEDALGTIGNISTAVKIIQLAMNLPERLYMQKYIRFTSGVRKYNSSERREILQHVSESKAKAQIPFILNVINVCEEEEKMDFLVTLTEAWMEERLDNVDYRRLAMMMERTPYGDLIHLKGLFEKQTIELRSVKDESLLTNGWLSSDNVALQEINQEAAIHCHLTANAWKFGEIVFGIKPAREPKPFAPSFILKKEM